MQKENVLNKWVTPKKDWLYYIVMIRYGGECLLVRPSKVTNITYRLAYRYPEERVWTKDPTRLELLIDITRGRLIEYNPYSLGRLILEEITTISAEEAHIILFSAKE